MKENFSNLALESSSDSSFYPYFVVYRYKSSPVGSPLYMERFITLFYLYQFVSNNYGSWSFYSIGKCLETFSSND